MRQIWQTILIALILVLCGCNDPAKIGENSAGSQSSPVSANEPAYVLDGMDFGPYIGAQDPNTGSTIDDAQITARLQLLVGNVHWIRTFGMTHGLENTGRIAHELGFKTALQAWISKDMTANEQELSNLIAAGQRGEADMLIVGSEVMLRGDLTSKQLIDYIDRVKQAVPNVPVATADTYDQLLAHSDVMDGGDVILANYYPYWQGIAVDNASSAINSWHQLLTQAAKGKPVMVAETGWPDAGETQGLAVPSPENAAFFFKNFVSWARANQVDYFYFEAFDEPWKANYEGPQGAHWGVWDQDGNLKPGMETVFNGETVADNWSQSPQTGGPGQATLEFTQVPPRGSFDNLEGRVLHVDPSQYRVAVYIYVSGWWTKPYFNQPLTTIQADGRWVCDITTGGVDEQASKIAAYVVPANFQPPLLSGDSSLPAELDNTAVASLVVNR